MMSPSERLNALRERAGYSRHKLALAMGYARGQSIARQLSPAIWGDSPYPLEFVARAARALVGRGTPPITRDEVFALAEPRAGVIVIGGSAVVSVPLVKWTEMLISFKKREQLIPVGSVEVAGLPAGDYFAVEAPNSHASGGLPAGATVIIDADATELRDGKRFLIAHDGEALIRLYRSNPARFESESIPPAPTIYPTGPVEVLGRAIACITQL